MPERCTDPTCEQHWPALCGLTWAGDCELPTGHSGNHKQGDLVWTTTSPDMYRDMVRAMATVAAAPPNYWRADERPWS